ncbi:MAG TPA: inorganic diphosphatase [Bryobacteraceae bacterium]|nr:inorganic diphosphatase [Bryobacteraceae bacterium]
MDCLICYAERVKLYDIDPGPDCPEIVRAIIEIPKNSVNKYEYDSTLDLFRLDRALYSPMHYPGDYGFIPGTLADDGDPLDIMVLVDEPSFTGCMMEARPVGLLHMVDGKENDQKVLAVPTRNPRYDSIHTIDQVFPHIRREIEYFFSIYKELQGGKTKMEGWGGPRDVRRVITESRQSYLDRTAAANAPDPVATS